MRPIKMLVDTSGLVLNGLAVSHVHGLLGLRIDGDGFSGGMSAIVGRMTRAPGL